MVPTYRPDLGAGENLHGGVRIPTVASLIEVALLLQLLCALVLAQGHGRLHAAAPMVIGRLGAPLEVLQPLRHLCLLWGRLYARVLQKGMF